MYQTAPSNRSFLNTKLITWMSYAIIFLAAISCTRQKQMPEMKSGNPYQMQAMQPDINQLKTAIAGKPIFSKLNAKLDFTKVQAVHSVIDDVSVYIIKVKGKDEYYATKINGTQATVELVFVRKMTDEQNGSIGLLKDGEGIIIDFHNGLKTIRDMSEPEYNVHFTDDYHGGSGFCQREKQETFKECFQAEAAEFCDSFISCIALASNPSVSILIGIACSCSASN